MLEELPRIYRNFTEQEVAEADYNLVGFFRLLYEIDQQNKAEVKSNDQGSRGANSTN